MIAGGHCASHCATRSPANWRTVPGSGELRQWLATSCSVSSSPAATAPATAPGRRGHAFAGGHCEQFRKRTEPNAKLRPNCH